ncbi:putative DMT superfamily transporter inner membrane protein [Vibrio aerogenes CECT 7868]|uniref:Putative DMT superfamily transporter inner membrane protein n=1 Tax=Vibrio aerogenes CECT 7868 TaxID=1216006 RepID=A0A1M5ZQ26_9VIBR|nr:EamA family transporter [Vibrio aerogenes]SHI26312.1 putative DMT superfamily transporter inner membrane protein [Vibrio aerogenes CECT 7868]
MRSINQWSALLITAITPLVWGSTYIVTSKLLPPDMPLLASAIRALPAGLILVAFSHTLPAKHWWLKLAVLGCLNIGLFFYCLFYAAYALPGGMAALVMSSQPLVVMFMSYLLLRSPLNSRHFLAAGAGISGIAMLVLNSQVALNGAGLLMGLLGTLCMATGLVLTKLWGRPAGMSLMGFTGWQLVFGGLILAPVALWQEGLPATLTTENLFGYSYLCLAGSVFAYAIWFWGIEKLPAVTLSFLGFLSPLSACVLGYLILGETLTGLQLFGALAILFSILCITQARDRDRPENGAPENGTPENGTKETFGHKPV